MGAPVNMYRYGGPRDAATVFGALDVPPGPGTAPVRGVESSFQNAFFFFGAETLVACLLAYLMRQEMRRGARR